MECSIEIPLIDQGIEIQAAVLNPHLEHLGRRLSRDYGGCMRHLWIDFELSPVHEDRRPYPWPFRFQKRVSLAQGARRWGLPAPTGPDPTGVGLLSVRPNYAELAATDLGDLPAHAIRLIHRDTAVLERKRARLGGFDALAFRLEILRYVEDIAQSGD